MAAMLAAMERLIEVVAQLRSPEGGCPWDLAQTPESLTPYIIEEAYETVDAIKNGDRHAIAEELGDLLLQVVLQGQIAREAGDFDMTEIADGIADKLIRRHPHIFGDSNATSTDEVRQQWEAIKAQEKGETLEESQRLSRKLDRYGRSLPPLTGAMKISTKAAAAGFEWDSLEGVWEKFHEEVGELKEAIAQSDAEHQESELGDVLFSLIQVARWQKLDPTAALTKTNHKFVKRLRLMESMSDRPLEDHTLAELDDLWNRAKANLRAEMASAGKNADAH
ncbi:MAG: nucleoside triphosphate pyrophosphohydrolase [Cyanobacteria bacterium P01_F01_bin.153]